MGLEKVKEEVLRKAKERADAILKDAKSEANNIEIQIQKRIATEKEKMLEETELMMDEMSKQEVSQANLDARNSMLKARKELIDYIMSKAKNKLEKLAQEEKRTILTNLLTQAQKEIKVKYIYCNKNDVQLVNQLVKKSGTFSVSNSNISGGLILENDDKTVRIDMSYESLLEKIKEENLTKVSNILFSFAEKKESKIDGKKQKVKIKKRNK